MGKTEESMEARNKEIFAVGDTVWLISRLRDLFGQFRVCEPFRVVEVSNYTNERPATAHPQRVTIEIDLTKTREYKLNPNHFDGRNTKHDSWSGDYFTKTQPH